MGRSRTQKKSYLNILLICLFWAPKLYKWYILLRWSFYNYTRLSQLILDEHKNVQTLDEQFIGKKTSHVSVLHKSATQERDWKGLAEKQTISMLILVRQRILFLLCYTDFFYTALLR